MLALSIRQPFAELILRGIKTLEYRSRPTRRVGERFWIYASLKTATKRRSDGATKGEIWSGDLAVGQPPGWLRELAKQVGMISDAELLALPKGVIVGSAVIEGVEEVGSTQLAVGREDARHLLPTANRQLPTMYAWKIVDVRRAKKLRKPQGQPQPVWFRPFR